MDLLELEITLEYLPLRYRCFQKQKDYEAGEVCRIGEEGVPPFHPVG